MRKIFLLLVLISSTPSINAQSEISDSGNILKGRIYAKKTALPSISVVIEGKRKGTVTNDAGLFVLKNLPVGKIKVRFSGIGFNPSVKEYLIMEGENIDSIELQPAVNNIEEVVVSGTMRAIGKMESPIPVEVYTPVLFKKNPVPKYF
jgi:outer membrane receptor for ferrienterochelin and colicins